MSPGALPFFFHSGTVENPSRDNVLFLDRPVTPGSLLALDLAPQFLSEPSRGIPSSPRRRVPLMHRFFDRPLLPGW